MTPDMTRLVAPLVWRQQSHDCHVAKTAFGDTAVQNESHALAPDRWGWWMAGSDEDDSPSGYVVTLEAAKAAAQADYAARIIAALDPATLAAMLAAAEQRGRKVEREEIAGMIEGSAYTASNKGRSLEPVSDAMRGMDMHHATIAAAIRARGPAQEGGE
jgi:hypothetical protein